MMDSPCFSRKDRKSIKAFRIGTVSSLESCKYISPSIILIPVIAEAADDIPFDGIM